jgi:O-antigen/teichoic acid export membrane protein
LIASIATQILGWIGTKVLYIRVAPSAGSSTGLAVLGLMTFIVLISGVVASIGDLRVGTAYTFFIARGASKKELTGAFIVFRFASFAIVSLAIVGTAIAFNWFPGYTEALVLFMLVPVLEIPATVYSYLRIAEGRTAVGQIPGIVEGVVRMALIVIFAVQFSVSGSTSINIQANQIKLVTDIAIAYFVGGIASICVCLPVFRNLSLDRFRASLKDMFTFALPLMGAMVLTYVVTMITPFLVKVVTGSYSVLTVYSATNAFLILLLFLPSAVCTPLFPELARMHARGETEALKARTRKAMRYTMMLLAPAILGVSVFRVDLLNIFYSSAVVAQGQLALIVMAFCAVPISLFRITGTALDSVGMQKREFYVSVFQLSVLVVSLVVLLKILTAQWWVVGAALSLLLSSFAGLVMNAYYLHRNLPISFELKSALVVLGSAALTFALFSSTFLGYFGIHLPVDQVLTLVVVLIAGLILYVGVLAASGELTKQDVVELSNTLGLPPSVGQSLQKICWRDSRPD